MFNFWEVLGHPRCRLEIGTEWDHFDTDFERRRAHAVEGNSAMAFEVCIQPSELIDDKGVEHMTYEVYLEAARAASSTDPAHDILHVERVVQNARAILFQEGGREEIVLPAVILHELFSYPKGHPDSKRSGDVCALRAREVLESAGFPEKDMPLVLACIRDHSFSKGVVPDSLEGRIVQDADRLDALGAIGIARTFATCAEMGTPFYQAGDPFCEHRTPDDKSYGIDHFYTKLLRLAEDMHTQTARDMARERTDFIHGFLQQWRRELST